jgi:hypothetical protein
MAVGHTELLELVRGIVATDSAQRDEAADRCTDHPKSCSALEADLLVRVLVVTRTVEPDPKCQEAQPNAIADIVEWHDIPFEAVAPLRALRENDFGDRRLGISPTFWRGTAEAPKRPTEVDRPSPSPSSAIASVVVSEGARVTQLVHMLLEILTTR